MSQRRVLPGRLRRWMLARLAAPTGPLLRTREARISPILEDFSERADHAARSAFLREHIFIHTHVPKTGGTALFHNLASMFGAMHCLDVRLSRSGPFADLSVAEMDEIHMISGHFDFGVHKAIGRRPLYIAAIREPVARAVSAYRYMQTAKSQPEHATCRDLPFEEAWAEMDRRFDSQRRDRQSHMLWGTSEITIADWDHLVRRIEDDYLLVIPQNRIADAVARLREAFGVYKAPVQDMNVSRAPEFTPSDDIAATIRDANALDARLFDYVADCFDARLARVAVFIAENCLQRRGPGD